MKIAVLIDGTSICLWQAAALRQLPAETEIAIYSCANSRPGGRHLRHALYYLLNLFTVRNPLTRSVDLDPELKEKGRVFTFESVHEGAWQRLPDGLLQRISEDRPDVIVKFGMSLLRVPEAPDLPVPILSYHHGDPEHYRGRPAGFYELFHGKRVMGQIVQILSNRLDAGAVVAFAETKVYPHSYRATLMDAYRCSPFIFARAIANAMSRSTIDKPPIGRVYRLPTNRLVASQVWNIAKAKLRRYAYGAFAEKVWEVSLAKAEPGTILNPAESRFPPGEAWHTFTRPKRYLFFADPFFAPGDDRILVEALNAQTGKGEIAILDDGGAERLLGGSSHFSFPGVISAGGSEYVVPEAAIAGPAHAYRLENHALSDAGELAIPRRPRLVDPILFDAGGAIYLFANVLGQGSVLRLWRAASLFARFEEHPCSPVRLSPAGSRMAGAIVRNGNWLYRLGQDDTKEYGNGLTLFRIEALDPICYREDLVGTLRFDAVKGPHTLNFSKGRIVFDWYRDRFSIFAGVRRVLGASRG